MEGAEKNSTSKHEINSIWNPYDVALYIKGFLYLSDQFLLAGRSGSWPLFPSDLLLQ